MFWRRAVIVAARSFLPERSTAVRPEPVEGHSSGHPKIEVIRKRPDFLAANRGKRFVTPGFVLLAHKRRDDHAVSADTIRYGITVTKKIGNAVARNRMKRRFRALLSAALPKYGLEGVDHIMIGRKQDNERDFASLAAELEKGLNHLAKKL